MGECVRGSEDHGEPAYGEAIRLAQSLGNSWKELCARFLPVASKGALWRYSRTSISSDPEQGWKLRISANILTAVEVLQTVAPFLQAHKVLFKAPSSLQELSRINAGLYYGYSQVGKFITVYPHNSEQAVFLARRLHELTLGMSAPVVPFDQRFRTQSCVYYRYGAFVPLEIEKPDGTRTLAIRGPGGELVSDDREASAAKLTWVSDPFDTKRARQRARTADSPLNGAFRAFRALAQRGKGGVYQAIDLTMSPPRLCILKEGRAGGEVNWDGRDGRWRAENEGRVLNCLQAAGVNVPRLYSSFEVEGNYYLAMEFVNGENLQQWLNKRRRRLTIPQVLQYGIQLSRIVSQIHAAGWVWRDCKPANVVVAKDGQLRPVDFEGACPIDEPDPLTWNTPGFSAPECHNVPRGQSRAPEDIYSLGATLYFLLTATLLVYSGPPPILKLRRNVPSALSNMISDMLAADPAQRPSAQTVTRQFRMALSSHNPCPLYGSALIS
ncbi:MAG TPA: protein kinase [Blastocatellia bacterium]|nr:protein kinase [Blastocatellia bacterium]